MSLPDDPKTCLSMTPPRGKVEQIRYSAFFQIVESVTSNLIRQKKFCGVKMTFHFKMQWKENGNTKLKCKYLKIVLNYNTFMTYFHFNANIYQFSNL